MQRTRVLERRLELVEIAALVTDESKLTISVGHRVLAPQTRVERQRVLQHRFCPPLELGTLVLIDLSALAVMQAQESVAGGQADPMADRFFHRHNPLQRLDLVFRGKAAHEQAQARAEEDHASTAVLIASLCDWAELT